MGREVDRLRIYSMNASGRNGKQFMDFRSSKIDDIIGQEQPDLFLLPGDEPNYGRRFSNYKSITEQCSNETVLLYNSNRVHEHGELSVKAPPIHDHFKKLVFPTFEVMTPPPTQNVVKKFHCLTWHFEAMLTTSDHRYKIGMDFMMFGQYLAAISEMQFLIGGDFNLPLCKMKEMLKSHNEIIAQDIENVKPHFRDLGYMDEMTDYVMRPQRRLRQLKLVQCGNAVNNECNPDFYVASKEMELFETKTMEKYSSSGKYAELKTKTETPYMAPTMTEMRVPFRPPKHSGG